MTSLTIPKASHSISGSTSSTRVSVLARYLGSPAARRSSGGAKHLVLKIRKELIYMEVLWNILWTPAVDDKRQVHLLRVVGYNRADFKNCASEAPVRTANGNGCRHRRLERGEDASKGGVVQLLAERLEVFVVVELSTSCKKVRTMFDGDYEFRHTFGDSEECYRYDTVTVSATDVIVEIPR